VRPLWRRRRAPAPTQQQRAQTRGWEGQAGPSSAGAGGAAELASCSHWVCGRAAGSWQAGMCACSARPFGAGRQCCQFEHAVARQHHGVARPGDQASWRAGKGRWSSALFPGRRARRGAAAAASLGSACEATLGSVRRLRWIWSRGCCWRFKYFAACGSWSSHCCCGRRHWRCRIGRCLAATRHAGCRIRTRRKFQFAVR
jgi:hypothetical protein